MLDGMELFILAGVFLAPILLVPIILYRERCNPFAEPTPARTTETEAKVERHSTLGVVSFGCSLLSGGLAAIVIAYFIVSMLDVIPAPDVQWDFYATSLLALASCLGFFALGLGVGSLVQPSRNKFMAILGTFTSSLVSVSVGIAWAAITLTFTVAW